MEPDAARYLGQLLAAHHAEDAFEPLHDDALPVDEEAC
jgi:hypothetical protein